jgi:hypothetical protein
MNKKIIRLNQFITDPLIFTSQAETLFKYLIDNKINTVDFYKISRPTQLFFTKFLYLMKSNEKMFYMINMNTSTEQSWCLAISKFNSDGEWDKLIHNVVENEL